MPLDMEVGLDTGNFVFNGNPAFPQKIRAQPHPSFGPCPLWLNGWIDQDATWYRGKPRPRRRCIRCGRSPLKGAQTPVFCACLLWPRSPISATAELLYQNVAKLSDIASRHVVKLVTRKVHTCNVSTQVSVITDNIQLN